MSNVGKFIPPWLDHSPFPGSYYSILKWGDPNKFKHPNLLESRVLAHISHLIVVFSSIFCQLSWQGGFSYGVKVAIAHKTLILTPDGSPASTKSLFLVADLLRQSLHPLFW